MAKSIKDRKPNLATLKFYSEQNPHPVDLVLPQFPLSNIGTDESLQSPQALAFCLS
jgi:hypothetical protein